MSLRHRNISREKRNVKKRGIAQMVARVVWDHEAAGSSPATPTTISGSGSVVERHLAKVNVASSNLVFRSKCAGMVQW